MWQIESYAGAGDLRLLVEEADGLVGALHRALVLIQPLRGASHGAAGAVVHVHDRLMVQGMHVWHRDQRLVVGRIIWRLRRHHEAEPKVILLRLVRLVPLRAHDGLVVGVLGGISGGFNVTSLLISGRIVRAVLNMHIHHFMGPKDGLGATDLGRLCLGVSALIALAEGGALRQGMHHAGAQSATQGLVHSHLQLMVLIHIDGLLALRQRFVDVDAVQALVVKGVLHVDGGGEQRQHGEVH
mmetsp:Transcript_6600/g.17106  ORF Transcript_6600/g.17106 Transcript_6600/m.17106 type:complete len:241 (-) Transcript_6600:848-1570(-)